MKAYFLNSTKGLMMEVDCEPDDCPELCGFDEYCEVDLTPNNTIPFDTLLVDAEGLLHNPPLTHRIGLKGYGQALAGNGLIVGVCEDRFVQPRMPLKWYEQRVFWVEALPGNWWAVKDVHCRNLNTMSYGELVVFLREPVKELVQ